MIDAFTLQKIKEAANVVDVLGDFLDLRKRGTDYECLCPFHNDRSVGNFKVSERKNLYICFACGESGDSIDFLTKTQGYTFIDAVRWLGRKYSIPVEGGEKFTPRPAKKRTPPPPLPMLIIDEQIVKARSGNTTSNTLCQWLRSLPWNEEERTRLERVLAAYSVGHSPKSGHTIFWQIDSSGNARTAKMMLYKPDGHRDKETPHNFTWVHTLLHRSGHINLDKCDVKTTLFGMHLLTRYPDAGIAIVESEKTALLCATAYGHPEHTIWMACGGKTNLTRQRLAPILNLGRRVTLYPDYDAIEEWEAIAKVINSPSVTVPGESLRDLYKLADNPKADMADVLVATMLRRKDTPPTAATYSNNQPTETATNTTSTLLQSIIQRSPKLEQFITTLRLKEI